MKNIVTLLLCCLAAVSAFAQSEFTLKGVMKHTDIEGGCWYLETSDGRYELLGLQGEYASLRVDEQYVEVLVRKPSKPTATVCMVGTIVQLVAVIDTVRRPHHPPVDNMYIKGKIHITYSGCYFVKTASGKRYELQEPIPKRYKKLRAKYARESQVVPVIEGKCKLDGVIINVSENSQSKQKTKYAPKYSDPR